MSVSDLRDSPLLIILLKIPFTEFLRVAVNVNTYTDV